MFYAPTLSSTQAECLLMISKAYRKAAISSLHTLTGLILQHQLIENLRLANIETWRICRI